MARDGGRLERGTGNFVCAIPHVLGVATACEQLFAHR